MGGKFCFFTDPALLGVQSDTQAFGPLPAAGGKDRFRVTHRHPATGTDAPAVAICDGTLCVQQAGPGIFTLILKPSRTPPFESPVVSYFIYRGIATSPFASGTPLIDANSAPGTGPNPPKIFTDKDPLERLFAYSHDPVQTHVVRSGNVIGAYAADCALEIVLQRLGFAPTLGFARRTDTVIEVPTLAADNGGVAWQADDEAWFDHWNDKERVLGFMDPCAYFGAFAQAKLRVGTGPDKGKVDGAKVFEKLLGKAKNRDVAWLDIRGNTGCSYNLFGLYGDLLRLVPGGPGIDFRQDGWPLRKLRLGDVPGADQDGFRRTGLCLPVGKSGAPAALVSKGYTSGWKPNAAERAPRMSVDTGPPDVVVPDPASPGVNLAFYRPITLAFPLADDKGATVLSAGYTRVNLYERTPAQGLPTAPLNIAGGDYVDGLFRLRDLRLDTNFANHALRFDIFWEEVLVDLRQDHGPAYAGAIGIAQDATHVALFAFPVRFLPGASSGPAKSPASLTAKFQKGAGSFETWLVKTFKDTVLSRTTIDAGTVAKVDAPITRAASPEKPAKPGEYGDLNDYCILILNQGDHAAMLREVDALAAPVATRPVFSRISAAAYRNDTQTNAPFLERTLRASRCLAVGSTGKLAWTDGAWAKRIVAYVHP